MVSCRVELLKCKSEKKELKDAIEVLEIENTQLKDSLNEAVQVQNIVKEINNKLIMLRWRKLSLHVLTVNCCCSESFEKRIQKVHNRFQRKLKTIR